jgi:hypothetical protein
MRINPDEAPPDAAGRAYPPGDSRRREPDGQSYRGCRFVATALALPDPGHPALAEVRAHKRRVHGLFATEFTRLGHLDPSAAADQFQLLVEGAMALFVTRPESNPASAARAMAKSLIERAAS